MTIDEITKLAPKQVQRAVAEALGWTAEWIDHNTPRPSLSEALEYPERVPMFGGDCWRRPDGGLQVMPPLWHTDLNAAMTLVPQNDLDTRFRDCLNKITRLPGPCGTWEAWAMLCPDKPLALCRAFLLWRGSVT